MIRKIFTITIAAYLTGLQLSFLAYGETTLGKPAPDFTLRDTFGKEHRLSGYKGKIVVLEWLNHNCPFVAKLYPTDIPGLMPQLQRKYTEKGVIWLSINSTNPDHKDFVTAEEANNLTQKKHARPTAVLIDDEGKVGKLYGAKTTPQIFIINEEGILVYAGAFDDNPTPRVTGNERNYVAAALDELLSGKPVSLPQTRQYGCSVKYR